MITDDLPKYAIYLRKSRADIEAEALGEGETLARHRNILFRLAEKHSILPEQITVYKEIVSGDSISERPEMQRLLSDVYQRKYAGVLVVEVERLARGNTKDQGEVSDAFQFGQAKIITPVKVYDPNNEFDQEYFEFGLFMSRREYKTIKRRMEAGRMESIAEGNYVGSIRPYGYDIERVNKKERILVEKPEESRYVRLMFDWFTEERVSAGEIARRLTDMHVPTMTGNREWNRATVKDILQNVHYTGKVRWNRRKRSKEFDAESGKLSNTKRRLTPAEYKVYEGKHKGFISQEQFDLAQTLFSSQIPVNANETIINPFAGIMRCAKCGKIIHYDAYKCKRNVQPRFIHPESKYCKMKSVNAEQVTNAIIGAIKVVIEDFEIRIENNSGEAEKRRQDEIIDALEAELVKREKQRRRLFEAYEEGVYDSAEFIERKQIVNAEIEEIKKQAQNAKEEAKALVPEDYRKKIIKLHEAVDLLNDQEKPARNKNIFLKSFIDHIDIEVIDNGRGKGGQAAVDLYLL